MLRMYLPLVTGINAIKRYRLPRQNTQFNDVKIDMNKHQYLTQVSINTLIKLFLFFAYRPQCITGI